MASISNVQACAFSSWFPAFQKHSIKGTVIPLDKAFLDYLQEDGIMLPDDEDVTKEGDGEVDTDDSVAKVSTFPALKAAVDEILNRYDQECFVKLNWSAPTDASWLRGGNMKCDCFNDIIMFLKSSDKINFDLGFMRQDCVDFNQEEHDSTMTLIIKKWANLNPSMEFRMFVYQGDIVGICQRDCTTLYEFLSGDKERLEGILIEFYDNVIHEKFPLQSYTIDVYVDRKNRVWIVDFNVFGPPTSSLMFDWEEFEVLSQQDPESLPQFRIVENQKEVHSNTAGVSRGPIDVSMAPDFSKFLEICKSQNEEEQSSSESEDK